MAQTEGSLQYQTFSGEALRSSQIPQDQETQTAECIKHTQKKRQNSALVYQAICVQKKNYSYCSQKHHPLYMPMVVIISHISKSGAESHLLYSLLNTDTWHLAKGKTNKKTKHTVSYRNIGTLEKDGEHMVIRRLGG